MALSKARMRDLYGLQRELFTKLTSSELPFGIRESAICSARGNMVSNTWSKLDMGKWRIGMKMWMERLDFEEDSII